MFSWAFWPYCKVLPVRLTFFFFRFKMNLSLTFDVISTLSVQISQCGKKLQMFVLHGCIKQHQRQELLNICLHWQSFFANHVYFNITPGVVHCTCITVFVIQFFIFFFYSFLFFPFKLREGLELFLR